MLFSIVQQAWRRGKFGAFSVNVSEDVGEAGGFVLFWNIQRLDIIFT
jgi:hypothetical protein